MESDKKKALSEGAITVAVCTFQRPQALLRLLNALLCQKNIQLNKLCVIVVDNDPHASARSTVENIQLTPLPWSVKYFVEEKAGVSHARNRCLIESETDFIAFIDDDEVPEPQWLASLIHTQLTTEADVVCGPVIPRYESKPLEWIIENKTFERKRFATNTKIGWKDSRSGNVLLHRNVVDMAGGGFDTRFATSGGEDSDFFWRAARSGATIVWSDEAQVVEYIPESRMNVKWILRRSYKGGQNWVRINAQSNSMIWLPMAVKGVITITLITPLIIVIYFISKTTAIKLAIRVAGGMGKITAWWASKKADHRIKPEHYVG